MKYTYEQMWDDTSNIVEKYGWELQDILELSDHYEVTIYNYKYETEAQFAIDIESRTVSDCYVSGGGDKAWLYDKAEIVLFHLKHIWLDFDKAMP